tara:strand:- start:1218 stop:1409 length:192 start_codon:yes stop_codon:yes gene_type:complete
MKMIDKMKMNRKVSAQKKSKGAEMVEYALVIALVSIAAIASLKALGGQVSTTFGQATSAIANA